VHPGVAGDRRGAGGLLSRMPGSNPPVTTLRRVALSFFCPGIGNCDRTLIVKKCYAAGTFGLGELTHVLLEFRTYRHPL